MKAFFPPFYRLTINHPLNYFGHLRRIDVLEKRLGEQEYIVGEELTVADIAVASYLNYVPLFNRNVDLSNIPNCVGFMRRMAGRDAFALAFGEGHQQLVVGKCDEWIARGPGGGGFQMPSFFK